MTHRRTDPSNPPPAPSVPWRIGSTLVMSFIGGISRFFMNIPNRTEAHGLDQFLRMLDKREAIEQRQRGLVTVSNHTSVIDDPLIWGTLPCRYHFHPSNHRWTLGSYDIVFKNTALSTFFTLGQVLPTHRLKHSPYGGLFQPTMKEAVRLLSSPSFSRQHLPAPLPTNYSIRSPDISDPFSSPNDTYTYSTNGTDSFPAPSAYDARQFSWVHIFPEGFVHQHPQKTMRYFKWGVARLILEPDVCPDIIPMWIEGNDQIMNEARKWPRFVPRVGKRCSVWFGDNIGGEQESIFHDLRRRWAKLAQENELKRARELEVGVLNDELKYGEEAVALREECTRQIRREVLKVRRLRGLPDEDPEQGLVDTGRQEGDKDRNLENLTVNTKTVWI